jgi:CheY-like chemotaxis protein
MSDDYSRFSTVLLMDTDVEDRCLVKSVLNLKGFDVIEALEEDQVVDLAFRWRPELILMELRRPIVRGFSAIRQIRKLSSLRAVPIISFSQNHPANQRELALAAGCAEHVSKPIDFDQLDDLIDKFLPGHELEFASTLLQ